MSKGYRLDDCWIKIEPGYAVISKHGLVEYHGYMIDPDRFYSMDMQVVDMKSWSIVMTLKPRDICRGRSSCTFKFESEDGRTWSFQAKQVLLMMQKAKIVNGEVRGRFGIVKRGQNYSMSYLGEE